MQHIYMHSNEHFEVFTTMVVVHSYRPHWPDELELSPGDVILVLSKHEEERWFGRLQDGQQGYFPASCVMELSQVNLPVLARGTAGSSISAASVSASSSKGLRRTISLRTSAGDNDSGLRRRYGNGHILQALRRGSRGGGAGEGGGKGLDGGQGETKGPFLVQRPQIPVPQPVVSPPQTNRSPSLLNRILSKCRKKSECQGATNKAFVSD
ncbi:hypothetical protein Q8A73_020406 [Channa argus]|nr:hypothetical protein Q8A73_020406 [Channa argus]